MRRTGYSPSEWLSPLALIFFQFVKELGSALKQAMHPSLETGVLLDGLMSKNHRTDFGAGL
jgi:hypothetical protein